MTYYFDKRIFRGAIGVLVFVAIIVLFVDGFSGTYEVCLTSDQFLGCEYPGQVIGDYPSVFYRYFILWTALIVGFSFLINHIMYNKGDKK